MYWKIGIWIALMISTVILLETAEIVPMLIFGFSLLIIIVNVTEGNEKIIYKKIVKSENLENILEICKLIQVIFIIIMCGGIYIGISWKIILPTAIIVETLILSCDTVCKKVSDERIKNDTQQQLHKKWIKFLMEEVNEREIWINEKFLRHYSDIQKEYSDCEWAKLAEKARLALVEESPQIILKLDSDGCSENRFIAIFKTKNAEKIYLLEGGKWIEYFELL